MKQESPAVKRESSTAKKKPPSVKHEHEANGTVSTTSTRPLPIYEDAKLAARLQAEENSRARPTRGIAQRKTASSATKSSPKKKRTERSARKIKNEDDSGVESSGDHEVKKTGAFHVSPPGHHFNDRSMKRIETISALRESVRSDWRKDGEFAKLIVRRPKLKCKALTTPSRKEDMGAHQVLRFAKPWRQA